MCEVTSCNLNYLLKRFGSSEGSQQWETYLVGDETRMTLIPAGETEMKMTEDIDGYSIGLTPLGAKWGRVETEG